MRIKRFSARSLALLKRVSSRKHWKTTKADHTRFFAAAESTLDDFYIFDGMYDASGDIVDGVVRPEDVRESARALAVLAPDVPAFLPAPLRAFVDFIKVAGRAGAQPASSFLSEI